MKYLFLILLVATLLVALVQPTAGQSSPMAIDSGSAPYVSGGLAVPRPRIISDSLLEHFRNDPDFDYSKDVQKGRSWMDLLTNWLLELLDKIFSAEGVRGAWGVAKYILIAAAAVAIILLFSKTGIRSLFMRSPGMIPSVEIITENIHEIDFSADISKAVAVGNFVRAVRLLYLQALKYIADADIIVWKPEKTNRDYESEIRKNAAQLSREFISLTNIFECVCYGKYAVTKQEYKRISAEFDSFFTKFRTGKNTDAQYKVPCKQELL